MTKTRSLYNILVVEDNPGDVLLIEEMLLEQIEDPAIVQVNNFGKAADYFRSANHPDIILLDLTLPDKSGEDLVIEMLKMTTVPIIILTGFADVEFSKKSISMGVSDYLVKDELNATILFKSILYAIERGKNLSAIQESEKKFSDLFNLSPQPMWVYQLDTLRFVQVNKAAVDLYGYSEAEFRTMTILDITAPQEKEKTLASLQEVPGEAPDYAGQFKHVKKSGAQITVEIYSTPIVLNSTNCRSVIAVDVTERIELDHKLTKAIIKTQEEERYEIGAELHDNVCQILATSLMSLGFVKKNIPPESQTHFESTREYITSATNEIRNLSHRLAPAFFDNSSFEEAIEVLIDNMNLNNLFDVNFLYSKQLKNELLNREIQLNLYRILQEQLRNIVKYSQAQTLSILLKPAHDNLVMQIVDDGVGFDTGAIKSGIGMANMRRRAELFGGSFRVVSAPGEGCSITVHIPFLRVGTGTA